jgi:hypothetical protein
MTLFAFGFAAVLFTALPPDAARAAIRGGVSWFDLFVMVTAGLAAVLRWPLAEPAPPWRWA